VEYDIRDIQLAGEGKRRIEWADHDMPVLAQLRQRFEKEKPLQGRRMSACLHVTAETANLVRTLKAGGADVLLCASNPLSTQDDVAAALVKEYGIPTFAIKGEDNQTYYRHIHTAVRHRPVVTMDDGADLVSVIHAEYPDVAAQVVGSMEDCRVLSGLPGYCLACYCSPDFFVGGACLFLALASVFSGPVLLRIICCPAR